MNLSGASVLVVGLGASGWSAARALVARGARVRVTEADDSPDMSQRAEWLRSRGAEVETGGHDLANLRVDVAVVSPGIAPDAEVLQALARAGIRTISEVELAYRLGQCDFLAVTGTNGKTTTTSLLAAMLDRSGIDSVAAGNIGLPLIDAIGKVGSDGAIAVEVSSFQLSAIEAFRPKVAVILNIAEDHTDWHGSVDAYVAAKARITENQTSTDHIVFNADDERVRAIAAGSAAQRVPFSALEVPGDGIGVDGDDIFWMDDRLMKRSSIPLHGRAGTEDALAALAAALSYGVDRDSAIAAAESFRPLRHRLEVVAEIDDVTYIDDSKATNPHATLAAVTGLADVVLIAGGRSKGIDLATLRETVPPVIAVVAMGESADDVADVFGPLVPVDRASSMAAAVRAARRRSVPGGSVLLAPACASLDMYESYAARGDDFARCVRDLKAEEG